MKMIEEYSNAFSKDFCNNVIEIFERMHSERQTYSRNSLSKNSDDRVSYDWAPHGQMHYYHHDVVQAFYAGINSCYDQYIEKYAMLKEVSRHSPKGMCIQRTSPHQGYHVWHVESEGNFSVSRVVAYTLYLNDVEEGGETEYLYQGLKVKPEAGKVVIWPSGWTHPHRGNPIYTGFKYIITGWYTYDQ
jgi:hypothetical protein